MKKKKMKKYYLSIYYIFRVIKSYNLIELSDYHRFILNHMFDNINSSFLKIKNNFDSNRINFFSYHYVLRKMLRILGLSKFCSSLSLIKDINKIVYSEKLFKLICDDLNYTFIPEII